MSEVTKIATLIGSDKGGVGKSMISLILSLAFDSSGVPVRIIEVDHQKKLQAVLGDRVDLSMRAAANLDELSKSRHAGHSFYGKVYEQWMMDHSVTDLGANVTTSLLDWVRTCGIIEMAAEDKIKFRFVAVAIPDDQSLKSAVSAIEDAKDTFGQSCSYYLVLNDIFGGSGFSPYEGNQEYQRLMRLRDTHDVTVLTIPHCDSILMEEGKARYMSPLDVLNNAKELAEKIGLNTFDTRSQTIRVKKWIAELEQVLSPLLTVPVRNSSEPRVA